MKKYEEIMEKYVGNIKKYNRKYENIRGKCEDM